MWRTNLKIRYRRADIPCAAALSSLWASECPGESCMYAEFFGLRELPFNNTPDPRFFFSTPDHDEALASLIYAVQQRKGFVLLTGEVGAGKTLVSRMMLKHFGPKITFASVHHAIQGAGDLLEALCSEFELAVEPGASQNRLVHTFHDFLLAEFSKDVPVVLVLDEAQALSVSAFEQLRMIGNLEADDAKLLQIVILGQPELQERFASHDFHQLRQRIFRTFHLPALGRDLTEEYIRHRLTISGAPHTDIFDRPAIDKIYKHSQGLPRLINTVCDNAMLSAYSANCRRMDGEFVESSVVHMMGLGEKDGSFRQDDTKKIDHSNGSKTVRHAGGASDQYQNSSSSDPTGTVISLLSRRIAELEASLDGSRVAQPNTQTASATNESEKLERLHQDVHRVLDEIARKSDEVNGQLIGMARQTSCLPTTVAQARAENARLEPLERQAAALTNACCVERNALAKEKSRITRMATTSRAVITEVRSLFNRLKRVTAKTQLVEQRAQTVCDRLAGLCDVAPRDADGRPSTSARGASCPPPKTSPATTIKEKTVPARHVTGTPDRQFLQVGHQAFQEALGQSRTSLADLRTLVRQTSDRRAVAASVDRKPVGYAEEESVLRPTVRLATHVERLLKLASGAAS